MSRVFEKPHILMECKAGESSWVWPPFGEVVRWGTKMCYLHLPKKTLHEIGQTFFCILYSIIQFYNNKDITYFFLHIFKVEYIWIKDYKVKFVLLTFSTYLPPFSLWLQVLFHDLKVEIFFTLYKTHNRNYQNEHNVRIWHPITYLRFRSKIY